MAISVAKLTECMPLSSPNKAALQEQHQREEKLNPKKRRLENNQLSPTSLHNNKKHKADPKDEMTDSQKKANFSALTNPSNGFNRHTSPLVNSKPGTTKKLVIKNFKGDMNYKTGLQFILIVIL